jgi:hypothetical protein
MSSQFAFAASTLAALAASLAVSVFMPSSAASAAETCLAAPKPGAPQGSRWYYRIDHAAQRKCWHLVKLDQKPQRTAKRAAAQPQPAQEPDAAPATATSAERVAESGTPRAPQWITRSASAVPTETFAPMQGPLDRVSERADDQVPAPVSAAPEQAGDTANGPVSPAQAAEPNQTNVAPQNSAALPPAGTMTQFVFVALAGLGLLAAAMFVLVDVRRRKTDVLTRVAREDTPSLETADSESPTFSHMPPMSLIPRHDDVEEALQRSRRRRRLAA